MRLVISVLILEAIFSALCLQAPTPRQESRRPEPIRQGNQRGPSAFFTDGTAFCCCPAVIVPNLHYATAKGGVGRDCAHKRKQENANRTVTSTVQST